MGVIDELVPLLKKLRLSGVLQSLELRLRVSVVSIIDGVLSTLFDGRQAQVGGLGDQGSEGQIQVARVGRA
jgi:hypothetical protein